jgi:hypothetical protein
MRAGRRWLEAVAMIRIPGLGLAASRPCGIDGAETNGLRSGIGRFAGRPEVIRPDQS